MKSKTFYVDGACSGNPGPGGWCSVELVPCDAGYITECSVGNKNNTTNGEMELTATYMSILNAYKSNCNSVIIFSDSRYVVDAIEKGWLKGWGRDGWKTVQGKDVKNTHIWKKVHKLIFEKGVNVRMCFVKGHNENALNELADERAVQARKELEE